LGAVHSRHYEARRGGPIYRHATGPRAVNVPAILAGSGGTLAALITGLSVRSTSRRTTKSNEATAAISTAVSAYDSLQRGQREEMNRMQGQLDVVRPALALAETQVISLRAKLAMAETTGALQATEIAQLHAEVDSLEQLIKTLREVVKEPVAA